MRSGVLGALVVALSLALSGCASAGSESAPSSAAPAPAPPPAPTVESGSIEGVVVDEEARPLVGVTAALIDVNLAATTDASGRFVVNQLPEGKYKVFLEKLGYESVAKLIDVRVGEVTQASFTMRALLTIPESLMDIIPWTGYIHCGVNPYYSINPCEPVTGVNKDKFVFVLRNGTLKEIVLEMTWKPAAAVSGQTMELNLCTEQPDPVLNKTLCMSTSYNKYRTGPPPVAIRVSDAPYKQTKRLVAGGGAGFQRADVLYQQSFDIFVTNCYYEECPEEYSALPPS